MRDSSNDPYRARFRPPPALLARATRTARSETDEWSNYSTNHQFRGVDAEIACLAERQHGVVSLAQLFDLGLSESDVKYRCRIGRLYRLFCGVYAVGHVELTDRGWFKAAVMSVGEGAALSHEPAAVLHAALPGWVPVGDLHVIAPRQTNDQVGLKTHHVLLDSRDVTEIESIPVTSAARTIFDLAEPLPVEAVRRTLRNAEVDGKLTHQELREQLRRNRGRRGIRKFRPLVAEGPLRVRSALEEKALRLLKRAGYPEPETNFRLHGMEVDIYFPELNLVIEIDGEATHSTPTSRFLDAERQERLEALGFTVIRWAQSDIEAGRLP